MKNNGYSLEALGERIRIARLTAGLTQTELAKQLKTGQNQITRWENGKREPTITRLLQIAEATGAPVNHLLGLDNGPLWNPDAERKHERNTP